MNEIELKYNKLKQDVGHKAGSCEHIKDLVWEQQKEVEWVVATSAWRVSHYFTNVYGKLAYTYQSSLEWVSNSVKKIDQFMKANLCPHVEVMKLAHHDQTHLATLTCHLM